MGLRINTNLASLRAQHALAASTKKLNTAMTRLSTGLRINSGADDVVGLAKSENLRTRIRGIDQARLNISSASSVLGVAEGYLSELTEVAQSMREIALQAADDTISPSDRGALTDKFNSLMSEYNRLTENAVFNNVSLLDGTFAGKVVQAGTDEGDTISVTIDDARSGVIGQVAIYTSQARMAFVTSLLTPDITDSNGFSVNGQAIAVADLSADGVSNYESAESAIAYVNAINGKAGITGVTARALSNVRTFTYTGGQTILASHNLVLNGVTVKTDANAYASTDNDVGALVTLINAKTGQTGIVATQDTATDELVLTASDGRNIDIQLTGTGAADDGMVMNMATAATARTTVYRGTFTLSSDEAFSITGATAEFAENATESVALAASTALDNSDMSTASNAGIALTILDNVIAQLQSRRGDIGSAINRFSVSESELAARLENLSAAESRIREADIAAETANMTQANILQQAGAAILSQANAAPQIALVLLQNL